MTAFQWKSRMRIWLLRAALVLVALQPVGAMAAGDRLASIGASIMTVKEMMQRIYLTELIDYPTDILGGRPYYCSREDNFRKLTSIIDDKIAIYPEAYKETTFAERVESFGSNGVWPFVFCSPIETPTGMDGGLEALVKELDAGQLIIRYPNISNSDKFISSLYKFIENPELAISRYKISATRARFIINYSDYKFHGASFEREQPLWRLSGWKLFDEPDGISRTLIAATRLFKKEAPKELSTMLGFKTFRMAVVPSSGN